MLPTLYAPLERLLASGGDTRLEIEPNTGRNRYACLPRPSTAVPFGSCTSSSISARAGGGDGSPPHDLWIFRFARRGK